MLTPKPKCKFSLRVVLLIFRPENFVPIYCDKENVLDIKAPLQFVTVNSDENEERKKFLTTMRILRNILGFCSHVCKCKLNRTKKNSHRVIGFQCLVGSRSPSPTSFPQNAFARQTVGHVMSRCVYTHCLLVPTTPINVPLVSRLELVFLLWSGIAVLLQG